MSARFYQFLSVACIMFAVIAVPAIPAFADSGCTGGCGTYDGSAKVPCPIGTCSCKCSADTAGNCNCTK